MEDREVMKKRIGFMKCLIIIELPEEIWVEIVARLPFRSIMRFKAVCQGWRRFIETSSFRRKFMFAHRNSSSSWSIMEGTFSWWSGEIVGFYGCERYGLQRSLDSYLPPHKNVDQNVIMDCVDGLVLVINVTVIGGGETYSVGNPLLNQWVQFKPFPYKPFTTGLVTRVEDGVVVEYKVVFMDRHQKGEEAFKFDIYSSKTGIWISKKIRCPRLINGFKNERGLSLNKKIHWLDEHEQALVTIDFFDEQQQQQCQVIPFPDNETSSRRTYTISGGFIVYIKKIHLQLRLWRLEEYTSDSGRWQLMQDIDLTSFGCDHEFFPIAMHPFETNIIYMATWGEDDKNHRSLVSIDLKTQELKRHTKSSTYNDTTLSKYMDGVYAHVNNGLGHKVFYAQQFILPQWMESLLPSM